MPDLRAWGTALAAALLLLAPDAGSQITFDDDPGDQRLGLSISGGISLGSYQAGVNYGLLEIYRHAAWDPRFRSENGMPRYRLAAVTGASAGNINTLLWAVEACTDLRRPGEPYRSPDPETSLFWEVWLSIGWDRLMNLGSDELALFDRRALIEDLVGPRLATRMADPRLREGCEVPAGITLTRIIPGTLSLQQLDIETQRHVTAFRVRVDTDSAPLGTRVRFRQEERITEADNHFGLFLRLQPHDGDVPFPRLLQAVKASASFPVAFAPVRLDVWSPRTGRDSINLFADGGFFDNNPVGLARGIYELGRDTAVLDLLYVNPYRHRAELRERRRSDAERAPSGGLAAVVRTLQGAVPTARQYELQLLARERAHRAEVDSLRARLDSAVRRLPERDPFRVAARRPDRQRARERLLLSSRAYPVLGEHLGSFGAFLARPGREFDFYVGMYDAFYMALWHHTCAHHGDATAEQEQVRDRCVAIALPRLIGSETLVRDPARQVLSWLYEREYGVPAGVEPPGRPEMQERVAVQRAFFDALGTRFTPMDAESRCHDPRLVHVLLCGDGLLEVLESIGADTAAKRILRRWQNEREGGERRVEPAFYALVHEPMHGATEVMDDIISRLHRVETLMRDRSNLHGASYAAPVTGLQWLFHASHLRSRPKWEWTPNSIPESAWERKIPLSYLGSSLGTGGVETRYTPAWNWGNPAFTRFSAILLYNADPIGSENRWYGGVGATLSGYVPKVWITEFGVGANVYQPLEEWSAGAPNPFEVEGYGVFVANQLRIGARWLPAGDHRGLLHGRRGWAISVGLNDPVGLIYWVRRLGR